MFEAVAEVLMWLNKAFVDYEDKNATAWEKIMMKLFKDRIEAGKLLAEKLLEYQKPRCYCACITSRWCTCSLSNN